VPCHVLPCLLSCPVRHERKACETRHEVVCYAALRQDMLTQLASGFSFEES
jgi:hypothetical protein